jgi:competence protein ComEC
LLPLALAAGAAAYMAAPDEPAWELLAAAAAIPGLLWFIVRRRGGGLLALVLASLACVGIGAIAGKVRSELVAAPILKEQIGPVRVEGTIVEIDASERSRRVRIDVRAIEGLTPAQTPRYVRFSFKGELGLSPGRAVACRAILSPPPRPVVPGDYEFHRDAWFQQLGAVGFAVGKCEPLAMRPPMNAIDAAFVWLGAIRRALAEFVYTAAGPEGGGMSAAMVSGDRSFITPDDAEALRLSGLAHLLSISGVHMVLVGGIIFFIVRFTWPLIEPLALRIPAVHAAALAAIIACTLYFAISGMEVATQRSYIIALIGFGAKHFDRPAISLRSLAIAMTLVVLLQPESVIMPGFQMSFAASAGLIALYEIWPRLGRIEQRGIFMRAGGWVIGAAATSLMASFATMPFALHHFDRAALFSVIANIVSTPVITLLTTPAAAAAALAAPFGLSEPFLWLMGLSLDIVLAIAHYSVTFSPDVDLPRLGAAGMGLAALAIALFCVLDRRGRTYAIIPAAAAIAVWLTAPQAVGYIADDGSVFLKQSDGWVELKGWRSKNGLKPLIIGDVIHKSPCSDKGAACTLPVDAGSAEIAPISGTSLAGKCPINATLKLTTANGPHLTTDPCKSAGQGGAAIESQNGILSLAPAEDGSGRLWTQRLYEPVPKPP